MKKLGFGTRMLSALLVLAMVLTMAAPALPRAQAVTVVERDDVGLNSGIDTKTTISWPIKIFDYNNDGMLFEFAQASHTNIINDGTDQTSNPIIKYAAYYGGGQPVPKMSVGTDYTLGATYNMNAYKNWGNTSAYSRHYDSNPTEVSRTIVQPVKNVSPMYLHLSYDYPIEDNTKSYVWVSDFSRDNNKYYNKDAVRYAVVVYKTNEKYSEMSEGIGHAMRPFWAVDNSNYGYADDITNLHSSFGWSKSGSKTGILVGREQRVAPSTDQWTYFVMDMKSNHVTDGAEADFGIQANWGAETGDTNERVAGIGFSMPICAQGEEMDISHIAYFSTRKEAQEFGKNAVAFNNDPGEYLGNTYTATYSTTNGPDDQPLVDPNAPTVSANGSDFVSVPMSSWDEPFASWGDYGTGMTIAQLTDTTTKRNYMQVGSADTEDDSMQFFSGSMSRNAGRFITIVYRTNFTPDTKSGFNVKDTDGTQVGLYRDSAYKNTFANTNGQWSTYIYDIKGSLDVVGDTDYNSLGTINYIKWWFPGLNTSEKIDIAYVDYFSTEAAAQSFGDEAVAYMNSSSTGTGSGGGSTGGTTVTTPVERPDSSNNALDFSYDGCNGYNDGAYATWTYDAFNTWLGGLTTEERVQETVDEETRTFVRVSSTDNYNEAVLTFTSDSNEILKAKARYVTLVYRTKGFTQNKQISFWVQSASNTSYPAANMYVGPTQYNNIAYITANYPDAAQTFQMSEDEWTFLTFDLNKLALEDSDYNSITSFSRIGMYLPGLNTSEQLEIAAIDYYSSESDAAKFGSQMAQYMNRKTVTTTTGGSTGGTTGGTVISLPGSGSVSATVSKKTTGTKGWNMGDNQAFGMLRASNGGGWTADNNTGGENANPAGYFSVQVGELVTQNASLQNTQRADLGFDAPIFLINMYDFGSSTTLKGYTYTDSETESLDTSYLAQNGYDLGYTLHTKYTEGLATVGLVSHTLDDNKRPVYRDETVDYIALMLYDTLRIPKTDTSGNYNYGYVKGQESTVYGTVNGKAVDLATALRNQLGITFASNKNYGDSATAKPAFGDAAKLTAAEKESLIGAFLDCKGNITSYTKAAYYLLHNLYVDNSYNQRQMDYNYLVLGKANVTLNGKDAFVFDGGFTYQDENGNYVSAINYDKQKGTIGLSYASVDTKVYKDEVEYQEGQTTTRYPFLPVTDATGDFAGRTVCPYIVDDGARGVTQEGATYVDRNYNFAMAANGEFVYHYEDALFFEFEGDDDVYLFVNGELVLDIGAGHSITKVEMNMNDYIDNAKDYLKNQSRNGVGNMYEKGYYDGMSNADFANLLNTLGITGTAAEKLMRAHKLNLQDGSSYAFDFYYMERKGWGSNCRIATNIVITDPSTQTRKTAYQNETEVEYAGVINPELLTEYGFSLTNGGNSKLYNISFKDANIGVTIDPKQGLVTHGTPVMESFDTTSATTLTVTGLKGAVNLDGTAYFVSKDGTFSWQEGTESKTAASLPLAAGHHTLTMYQVNAIVTDKISPAQNATVTYGGTSEIFSIPGIRVCDANGKTLNASDLKFTVSGYYDEAKTQPTGDIQIVIDDDADLMRFLQTLQSDEGTQTGEKESLFGGAGLWRHATLSVRGMYYTLTEEQKQAQVFDNTVFTTATPSLNSTTVKKGQASHRVYTDNAIKYYQWADHNMFVSYQRILNEAGPNSVGEGSQLHEYADFFASLKSGDAYSLSGVNVALCDKKGTVQKTVEGVTLGTDKNGTAGLITRYKDAGVYHLYLLMYKGTTPTLEQGKHAIISVTIYVPYVADSVFVLDYGLTTAHLDAGGELFKNDKLFGIDGTNVAKFMGLSTQVPSYLDPVETSGTQYNAINFTKQDKNVFNTEDGYYTMTFKPGTSGKTITYSTVTGQYSLTDAGTAKVTAMVPQDWENAYIYYWYDDYTDNGWPGFAMNKKAAGEFELDIAGDITNIVISNGADVKTVDLKMTPGMASLVTVKSQTDGEGRLLAEVTGNVQKVTVSAKVPAGWGDVYLHYWVDSGSGTSWPGKKMTAGADGWYTLEIPGNINRVIVNNGDGNGKQTPDLTVTPGRDAWITVPGVDTTTYKTVTAEVPEGWNTTHIYYWGSSVENPAWAGHPMKWLYDDTTKGTKVFQMDIPGDVSNIIINNGKDSYQSIDLETTAGLNKKIKITNQGADGKFNANVEYLYNASVSYSAEYFTVYTKVPAGWGTPYLYYWFSDGSTTNLYWPGTRMTEGSDGWYSLRIPSGVTHVLVDNGYRDVNDPNHKQTVNLEVEEGADAWITVTDSTKTTYDQNGENPMVKHLATITEPGLTFSPSNFMDSQYDLYMAMSVHDVDAQNIALDKTVDVAEEAQMYKKISVLPATVVYYEDDFPAIHYIQEAGDDVNVFEDLGTEGGSGGLSQDVDQDTEYGSDPSYDSNSDMSGNTTKKVTIRKAGDIAYFTFTGTGFELISRTNADKYATVSLSVYKAEDVTNGIPSQNATRLQFIPVVTEFDQGGDGGTEVIYQVPVVRVNDLAKGSYTVIISGSPSRDWGNKYPGNDWDPSNPTALPEIIDSYLYIDGLRIYQPMGAENDNYADNENGATFAELRKLVVDGYAALASYDGDALTVGTGTNTWVENRNGEVQDGDIDMGFTQVNKVDDYLVKGPNNEVYMHGSLNNSAIVFYVKEEAGAKVHNLQIAVHAMDEGLFLGAGSTGMSSQIYYGIKTEDGFGWEPLVTATSATEQYYTIDYTKCPLDANGYYQVAVKANTGMASFTSIKYNGLLINSMVGTPASMRYVNGVLQVKNAATETWEPAAVGEMPMFLSMRSQLMAEPMGNDTEDDPVEPSEPAAQVTVQISSATLSLEEETFVNLYLTGENLETLDPGSIGLLTWSAAPDQATVETAQNNYPGAVFDEKGRAMVRTGGIPAKMLGDDIYLRGYAKTADGTYVYTQLMRYSPKMYAMSRLEKSEDAQLKALCVALLNYGAQAQKYFGYRTDALMNADLTAQQQALVSGYTDDMVTPVAKADEAKAGVFVNNQGFRKRTASVSLDGVFAINYYFTPAKAVEGSVTFYCWSAETYEGATALTAQNATAAVTMEPADNGVYYAKVDGIAAKDFDEPVYVAAVYEAEGQTQCTGIIAYSLSGYFAGRVQKESGQLKDLSAAAAVYGFYAKNYFVK